MLSGGVGRTCCTLSEESHARGHSLCVIGSLSVDAWVGWSRRPRLGDVNGLVVRFLNAQEALRSIRLMRDVRMVRFRETMEGTTNISLRGRRRKAQNSEWV